MSNDSEQRAAVLARLSTLMDGELEDDAVREACGHWRESTEARSAWHAYHVIGDVLRSDDLACDPAADAGFLDAFRARLANEPVVLAPQAYAMPSANDRQDGRRVVNAGRNGRRSWIVPSAVAAGFVAVAGALVLTRAPGTTGVPDNASAQIAVVNPAERPAAVVPASLPASMAPASEPQVFVANGQFIRDARLDRYLSAHKQFAGSSALGVPSAFLRNSTADAADR